jgi:probable rRNA maturation factor
MSTEIYNETDFAIDQERIMALASFALDFMDVHPLSELGIKFVDEAAMTAYHIEFMDEDGPTDVMSWPSGEFLYARDEGLPSAVDLGSIAICPTVAERQAAAAGHETINEILLLTTHGILHLLGYDHAEPEEHKIMFGLQGDILLGFYATEGKN